LTKGLMVGAWGVRISVATGGNWLKLGSVATVFFGFFAVAVAVVTNFLIWQLVRVAVAPK
jgi:hypothetical protein